MGNFNKKFYYSNLKIIHCKLNFSSLNPQTPNNNNFLKQPNSSTNSKMKSKNYNNKINPIKKKSSNSKKSPINNNNNNNLFKSQSSLSNVTYVRVLLRSKYTK